MAEYVVLVDEQDNVVGQAEKLAAHEAGLMHRAFSIMLVDDRGAEPLILIHQRHPKKYHGGGLWTNACCSHPRVGEAVFDAAHRRLQEELGVSVPLKKIGEFSYRATLANGLIEHEFDHIFLGWYQGETIAYHPDEISAIEWVTEAELANRIQQNPDQFSPWLSGVLAIYHTAQAAASPLADLASLTPIDSGH